MRRNQQYEAFRPPLTEEQKDRIHQAENPAKEYGLIAVEEAKKQLSVAVNAGGEHNALPESEDACLRVPAVDPRGQYSILSMKVSLRSRGIESALPLREQALSVPQQVGSCVKLLPEEAAELYRLLYKLLAGDWSK